MENSTFNPSDLALFQILSSRLLLIKDKNGDGNTDIVFISVYIFPNRVK